MTGARILIVEDEKIVSEDIKDSLKNLGYDVAAVASSADEAMEKAAETRPDLVLIDIMLKGEMNGIGAAEQIRTRFDIPVVYLTAYADEKTLSRAKLTEPYGYILKPFEERELHTTIEIALYKHRMEKERAHLLAREQAARAGAEAASRVRDEFLSIISHELRTPLTPVLGWARLLREGGLDEATRDHALESIERNAQLQTRLIEGILDFSRILMGQLRIDVRPVKLVRIIEAAIDSIRPAAATKAIKIESVLDPAVSDITGDPARLQQIVWNLLSNAVKFTPKGGRVEVRLESADPYARITVSDTGVGISREFLPHVFDYFRQANASTTRRYEGLGLGLSIVRHLVELHGRTVEAQSPGEGRGATFIVNLPLSKPRPQTAAPGAQMGKLATDYWRSATLKGLRVLIVDDDIDSRELISVALEQYGAETMAVASAAEAFDALQKFKPDVLVCDIGMPGEDGYDLIKRVRALELDQGGGTPAIALTAFAGVEDRQRAISAGYQMHVAKPVEPESLVEAITILSGRKS